MYERMWKDLLHRESRIARKQIKCVYSPRQFLPSLAYSEADHTPSSLFLTRYSSLPLTTADIALLYDDFALGRSVVPPHAACVRPALIRWDPRAPLSLENCVVAEMKDVARAMLEVFSVTDIEVEMPSPAPPPEGYVDALGEPIDSALFTEGFRISSSEEVWGVEASRVAQARITQARRFREWALD
jgi:hypothetical protein